MGSFREGLLLTGLPCLVSKSICGDVNVYLFVCLPKVLDRLSIIRLVEGFCNFTVLWRTKGVAVNTEVGGFNYCRLH